MCMSSISIDLHNLLSDLLSFRRLFFHVNAYSAYNNYPLKVCLTNICNEDLFIESYVVSKPFILNFQEHYLVKGGDSVWLYIQGGQTYKGCLIRIKIKLKSGAVFYKYLEGNSKGTAIICRGSSLFDCFKNICK